jgi:predicted methyltransferase
MLPSTALYRLDPKRRSALKTLLAFIVLSVAGLAQAANEIDMKVEAALAAESRPEADRARDDNRLPLETLNFFGMKDNMRVLELLPGRGWYTRVLAPVLAENGKLYVAISADRVKEDLLGLPGYEKVTALETGANLRRSEQRGVYLLDPFEFGVTNLDMVLTFRNMHNFQKETRDMINTAVFKALKPGGLYGVIDHTRRHMESDNSENRRRVDPVVMIKELLDHGFEFVDQSDLHYRADDELEYEVGRRSVSGNTDRFTFLFRKP